MENTAVQYRLSYESLMAPFPREVEEFASESSLNLAVSPERVVYIPFFHAIRAPILVELGSEMVKSTFDRWKLAEEIYRANQEKLENLHPTEYHDAIKWQDDERWQEWNQNELLILKKAIMQCALEHYTLSHNAQTQEDS